MRIQILILGFKGLSAIPKQGLHSPTNNAAVMVNTAEMLMVSRQRSLSSSYFIVIFLLFYSQREGALSSKYARSLIITLLWLLLTDVGKYNLPKLLNSL